MASELGGHPIKGDNVFRGGRSTTTGVRAWVFTVEFFRAVFIGGWGVKAGTDVFIRGYPAGDKAKASARKGFNVSSRAFPFKRELVGINSRRRYVLSHTIFTSSAAGAWGQIVSTAFFRGAAFEGRQFYRHAVRRFYK